MPKHTFREYLKQESKSKKFKEGFEKEREKLGLGYQISSVREQAGLTQAELAERIGTCQSNISRLEQGNYNFTIEMLQKIAVALKAELKIKFAVYKKAA